MTSLAIELNDAGIRLARPGGLLVTEPGYALVRGEALIVGSEAFREARLEPRQVLDRFWTDLSLDPLLRGRGPVRTNADVAFAQLSSLWSRFGKDVSEVVLVVPASFTMEQLGLVLGMADACEMPVAGVVDAAVASSEPHPGCALFHLEIGLHHAILTSLEQDVELSRGNFEILEGVGLTLLRERWVQRIAAAFVSQTRFDPLHNAHAEQALYDRLPGFLDAAAAQGAVRVELSVGERTQTAEVGGVELADVTSNVCGALGGVLERMRPPGSPVLVQLGSQAGELPGVSSLLVRSRDVETCALAPEGACVGALSRLDQIRSSDGRIKLVTRLGPSVGPGAQEKGDPGLSPSGCPPTHVVYQGWLYQIGAEPFTIGTTEHVGGSGIRVPPNQLGELGGDTHCVLKRESDRLLVEGSGSEVLLNGHPVEGSAELRVGDVVRLGSTGVEIQLVAPISERTVSEDGA
jgi:hypothetical protein